jgi:hypothetical protein
MSRSTKAPGPKSAGRPQPDILAMLRKLDTEAPRILDELEQEEVVAVLEELLTWLTEIQPRVRSYLTRRARQRLSRDLDEQMVDDLRYYRLLLVNFTLLRERLLQEPPLA